MKQLNLECCNKSYREYKMHRTEMNRPSCREIDTFILRYQLMSMILPFP